MNIRQRIEKAASFLEQYEDETNGLLMGTSEIAQGLRELLKGMAVEEDNYGQLVIYTGLMRGPNGTLVDFIDEEER